MKYPVKQILMVLIIIAASMFTVNCFDNLCSPFSRASLYLSLICDEEFKHGDDMECEDPPNGIPKATVRAYCPECDIPDVAISAFQPRDATVYDADELITDFDEDLTVYRIGDEVHVSDEGYETYIERWGGFNIQLEPEETFADNFLSCNVLQDEPCDHPRTIYGTIVMEPPNIVRTSPVNGSTSIDIDKEFTIIFSTVMGTSTVSGECPEGSTSCYEPCDTYYESCTSTCSTSYTNCTTACAGDTDCNSACYTTYQSCRNSCVECETAESNSLSGSYFSAYYVDENDEEQALSISVSSRVVPTADTADEDCEEGSVSYSWTRCVASGDDDETCSNVQRTYCQEYCYSDHPNCRIDCSENSKTDCYYGACKYSYRYTEVTITPDTTWQPGSEIIIYVDEDLSDANNNDITGQLEFSFITKSS